MAIYDDNSLTRLYDTPLPQRANPTLQDSMAMAYQPQSPWGYDRSADLSEFTKGLQSTSYSLRASAARKEALKEQERQNFARAKQLEDQALTLEQRAAETAPRKQEFLDAWNNGGLSDWAMGTLGSAVPTAIPPILAGLATALPVGRLATALGAGTKLASKIAGAAGFGGAYYPSYQMESAEAAAEAMRDPEIMAKRTPGEILDTAMYKGLTAGAMEALVPAGVAGVGRGLLKAGVTLPRGVRNLAKGEVIPAAGTEFLTEGAQSLIGQAAQKHLRGESMTDNYDWTQTFNEAMAGMVGGAGMATPGALGRAGYNWAQGKYNSPEVQERVQTAREKLNLGEQKANEHMQKAAEAVAPVVDALKQGAQDLTNFAETKKAEYENAKATADAANAQVERATGEPTTTNVASADTQIATPTAHTQDRVAQEAQQMGSEIVEYLRSANENKEPATRNTKTNLVSYKKRDAQGKIRTFNQDGIDINEPYYVDIEHPNYRALQQVEPQAAAMTAEEGAAPVAAEGVAPQSSNLNAAATAGAAQAIRSMGTPEARVPQTETPTTPLQNSPVANFANRLEKIVKDGTLSIRKGVKDLRRKYNAVVKNATEEMPSFDDGAERVGQISANLQKYFSNINEKNKKLKIYPNIQIAFLENPTLKKNVDDHIKKGYAKDYESVQGITIGAGVNKRSLLFANAIKNGNEVGVLLHEIGVHIGMHEVFGKKTIHKLATRIVGLIESNNQQEQDIAKRARNQALKATNNNVNNPLFEEELVAYFIEYCCKNGIYPPSGERNALLQLMHEILEAIKRFLKLEYKMRPENITPQELVNFAWALANNTINENVVGQQTNKQSENVANFALEQETAPARKKETPQETFERIEQRSEQLVALDRIIKQLSNPLETKTDEELDNLLVGRATLFANYADKQNYILEIKAAASDFLYSDDNYVRNNYHTLLERLQAAYNKQVLEYSHSDITRALGKNTDTDTALSLKKAEFAEEGAEIVQAFHRDYHLTDGEASMLEYMTNGALAEYEEGFDPFERFSTELQQLGEAWIDSRFTFREGGIELLNDFIEWLKAPLNIYSATNKQLIDRFEKLAEQAQKSLDEDNKMLGTAVIEQYLRPEFQTGYEMQMEVGGNSLNETIYKILREWTRAHQVSLNKSQRVPKGLRKYDADLNKALKNVDKNIQEQRERIDEKIEQLGISREEFEKTYEGGIEIATLKSFIEDRKYVVGELQRVKNTDASVANKSESEALTQEIKKAYWDSIIDKYFVANPLAGTTIPVSEVEEMEAATGQKAHKARLLERVKTNVIALKRNFLNNPFPTGFVKTGKIENQSDFQEKDMQLQDYIGDFEYQITNDLKNIFGTNDIRLPGAFKTHAERTHTTFNIQEATVDEVFGAEQMNEGMRSIIDSDTNDFEAQQDSLYDSQYVEEQKLNQATGTSMLTERAHVTYDVVGNLGDLARFAEQDDIRNPNGKDGTLYYGQIFGGVAETNANKAGINWLNKWVKAENQADYKYQSYERAVGYYKDEMAKKGYEVLEVNMLTGSLLKYASENGYADANTVWKNPKARARALAATAPYWANYYLKNPILTAKAPSVEEVQVLLNQIQKYEKTDKYNNTHTTYSTENVNALTKLGYLMANDTRFVTLAINRTEYQDNLHFTASDVVAPAGVSGQSLHIYEALVDGQSDAELRTLTNGIAMTDKKAKEYYDTFNEETIRRMIILRGKGVVSGKKYSEAAKAKHKLNEGESFNENNVLTTDFAEIVVNVPAMMSKTYLKKKDTRQRRDKENPFDNTYGALGKEMIATLLGGVHLTNAEVYKKWRNLLLPNEDGVMNTDGCFAVLLPNGHRLWLNTGIYGDVENFDFSRELSFNRSNGRYEAHEWVLEFKDGAVIPTYAVRPYKEKGQLKFERIKLTKTTPEEEQEYYNQDGTKTAQGVFRDIFRDELFFSPDELKELGYTNNAEIVQNLGILMPKRMMLFPNSNITWGKAALQQYTQNKAFFDEQTGFDSMAFGQSSLTTKESFEMLFEDFAEHFIKPEKVFNPKTNDNEDRAPTKLNFEMIFPRADLHGFNREIVNEAYDEILKIASYKKGYFNTKLDRKEIGKKELFKGQQERDDVISRVNPAIKALTEQKFNKDKGRFFLTLKNREKYSNRVATKGDMIETVYALMVEKQLGNHGDMSLNDIAQKIIQINELSKLESLRARYPYLNNPQSIADKIIKDNAEQNISISGAELERAVADKIKSNKEKYKMQGESLREIEQRIKFLREKTKDFKFNNINNAFVPERIFDEQYGLDDLLIYVPKQNIFKWGRLGLGTLPYANPNQILTNIFTDFFAAAQKRGANLTEVNEYLEKQGFDSLTKFLNDRIVPSDIYIVEETEAQIKTPIRDAKDRENADPFDQSTWPLPRRNQSIRVEYDIPNEVFEMMYEAIDRFVNWMPSYPYHSAAVQAKNLIGMLRKDNPLLLEERIMEHGGEEQYRQALIETALKASGAQLWSHEVKAMAQGLAAAYRMALTQENEGWLPTFKDIVVKDVDPMIDPDGNRDTDPNLRKLTIEEQKAQEENRKSNLPQVRNYDNFADRFIYLVDKNNPKGYYFREDFINRHEYEERVDKELLFPYFKKNWEYEYYKKLKENGAEFVRMRLTKEGEFVPYIFKSFKEKEQDYGISKEEDIKKYVEENFDGDFAKYEKFKKEWLEKHKEKLLLDAQKAEKDAQRKRAEKDAQNKLQYRLNKIKNKQQILSLPLMPDSGKDKLINLFKKQINSLIKRANKSKRYNKNDYDFDIKIINDNSEYFTELFDYDEIRLEKIKKIVENAKKDLNKKLGSSSTKITKISKYVSTPLKARGVVFEEDYEDAFKELQLRNAAYAFRENLPRDIREWAGPIHALNLDETNPLPFNENDRLSTNRFEEARSFFNAKNFKEIQGFNIPKTFIDVEPITDSIVRGVDYKNISDVVDENVKIGKGNENEIRSGRHAINREGGWNAAISEPQPEETTTPISPATKRFLAKHPEKQADLFPEEARNKAKGDYLQGLSPIYEHPEAAQLPGEEYRRFYAPNVEFDHNGNRIKKTERRYTEGLRGFANLFEPFFLNREALNKWIISKRDKIKQTTPNSYTLTLTQKELTKFVDIYNGLYNKILREFSNAQNDKAQAQAGVRLDRLEKMLSQLYHAKTREDTLQEINKNRNKLYREADELQGKFESDIRQATAKMAQWKEDNPDWKPTPSYVINIGARFKKGNAEEFGRTLGDKNSELAAQLSPKAPSYPEIIWSAGGNTTTKYLSVENIYQLWKSGELDYDNLKNAMSPNVIHTKLVKNKDTNYDLMVDALTEKFLQNEDLLLRMQNLNFLKNFELKHDLGNAANDYWQSGGYVSALKDALARVENQLNIWKKEGGDIRDISFLRDRVELHRERLQNNFQAEIANTRSLGPTHKFVNEALEQRVAAFNEKKATGKDRTQAMTVNATRQTADSDVIDTAAMLLTTGIRGFVGDKKVRESIMANRPPRGYEQNREKAQKALADLGNSIDGVITFKDLGAYKGKIDNKDMPILLTYKGNIDLLKDPNLLKMAVIGTLKPTDNIIKGTQNVVSRLAEQGVVIVSGLAKGVDRAAHEQALATGAKTIAILPSTIKNVYPNEHAELAQRIVQNGGLLISEYFTEPRVQNERVARLVDRDRLQALFSDGVFLVASYSQADKTAGMDVDVGSKYALQKAYEWNIPRIALAGIENDPYYNMNREVIKSGGISIKNPDDLADLIGKFHGKKSHLNLDTDSPLNQSKADAVNFISKVLGDSVGVAFRENAWGEKKDVVGEFSETDGKRLITLAMTGDMLSTAYHESFHAFLGTLKDKAPQHYKKLLQLSKQYREPLLAKLKELSPSAHESAMFDDEELATYTYQLTMMGMLPSNALQKKVLGKIQQMLYTVGGLFNQTWRNQAQESADVLEAETQLGMVYRKFNEGAMATSFSQEAFLKQLNTDLNKKRHAQTLNKVMDALGKWGDKLLYSADAVLRRPNIDALNRLADKFYNDVVERSDSSLEQGDFTTKLGIERNLWVNNYLKVVSELDDNQKKAIRKALLYKDADSGRASLKGNKTLEAGFDKMRSFFDELYDDLAEKGMASKNVRKTDEKDMDGNDIYETTWISWKEQKGDGTGAKYRKNYFPFVWSQNAIKANRDKFISLLIPEIEDAVKKGIIKLPKDSNANEHAVYLVDSLLGLNHEQDYFSTVPDSIHGTPYGSATESRYLGFIQNREKFDEFFEQDMDNVVTDYVIRNTKRALFQKIFGYNGNELLLLMKEAEEELAHKNGLYTIDELTSFTHEELADLGLDYNKIQEEMKKTEKLMRPYHDAVAAMLGALGQDLPFDSPLRTINAFGVTYQNFRLLTFSLFTSFQDVAGLFIHGGTLQDAFDGFLRGLNQIWHTWKKTKSKDEWVELAADFGIVDPLSYLGSIGELNGTQYMTGKMRGYSNKFFRIIGLEGWNRGLRTQAAIIAERQIKKWQRDGLGDTKAEKMLYKRIFGSLNPKDIQMDGEHLRNNDENRYALRRMVDDMIMAPTAANRPAWASNPRYLLFAQLKTFTYTMHRVMMRGILEQVRLGNVKPAAAAVASIFPLALAGYMVKELALSAIDDDDEDWKFKPNNLAGYIFQRAGVLGVPQMYLEDVFSGDFARMLGPTADQIQGWASIPFAGMQFPLFGWTVSHNHQVGKELVNASPFASLVKRIPGMYSR